MKYVRLKPSPEGSDRSYAVEEYLHQHAEELNISSDKIPTIISALEYIFGKNKKWNDSKKTDIEDLWTTEPYSDLSILIPENFPKYFNWNLLSEDISSKEFSIYRGQSFNDNIKILNKWINEGKRLKVYNKFSDINNFNNKEDFENIIKSIFYLSQQPAKIFEKNENLFYNLVDLYLKLKNNEGLFQLPNDNNNFKEYLYKLFENAKSPYLFEDSFLNFMNTDINFSNFPISLEERTKLVLNYLEEYVKNRCDFDDIVWYLFYGTEIRHYEKITGSGNRTWRAYPEGAKKILIKFIKDKSFISFINEVIYSPEKGKYYFTENIKLLFNTRDDFIKFVEEEIEKCEVKEELLKFIERLKEFGFEKAIPFEFKYIKPITRYNLNVHY